jgi:hypothetical protein
LILAIATNAAAASAENEAHKLERLYRQTVNYEVALINVQEMRQKGAFFAFAFLFVIPEGNLLLLL